MKKECTQICSFLPGISFGQRWYYSSSPTADNANRLERFPSLPQKCTKPIVLNNRLSSARQKLIANLTFPGLLPTHSCLGNRNFPLSSMRFIKRFPFFSSAIFYEKSYTTRRKLLSATNFIRCCRVWLSKLTRRQTLCYAVSKRHMTLSDGTIRKPRHCTYHSHVV